MKHWEFSGPEGGIAEVAVDELEQAAGRDLTGHEDIERALAALVGMVVQRHEAPEDALDEHAEAGVHERIKKLLERVDGAVAAYVSNTIFEAESADEGDIRDLCVRRSAIQILIDSFDAVEMDLLSLDEVELLDESLAPVLAEHGPVGDPLPGLPEHHWWWQYPDNAPDA